MAWKPASISAELARARWRSSTTGPPPSRTSSDRPPSPRSRTCSPGRCRSSATSSWLVDTATKWRATSTSSPSASSSQSRAVAALVIVSRVVKVFDTTMNSVSAGSRSRVASQKSVPSMLDTNRNVQVAVAEVLQRLVGHGRTQVAAADADVDDGCGSAGRCGRSTLPTGPGSAKPAIGVEHRVHVGDDVDAVDLDHRRRPAPAGRRAARLAARSR